MPQENMKQNDKSNFPRFRPRGEDDNNTPRKGPKFSIYWIWGIIAAVLLGFNFYGAFTPDAHHLDSEQDFRVNMLEKGDVAKLVLVTNKNLVRVYIKKDSLDKPYYKDKLGKSLPVAKVEGPRTGYGRWRWRCTSRGRRTGGGGNSDRCRRWTCIRSRCWTRSWSGCWRLRWRWSRDCYVG